MKIVTVRRISQGFFFALFVWFAFVSSVGKEIWQMRNWPVNWFLQLDPLVAAGTMLTTHTLYWPLLWALAVVVLTILVGRFFCGWLCPFGTIHHFTGYLAHRKKKLPEKLHLNKYRKAQRIKYYVLAFMLGTMILQPLGVGLYTGLLDPIPLVTRSFNLALMPVVSGGQRFYESAWLIFGIFAAAVLLNLFISRFYCRFVCPLGAMFGIFDRFAIWRIGKKADKCSDCKLCEKACEGGCAPAGKIKIAECVLCFNCRQGCVHDLIAYQFNKSQAGEITGTSVSRRGFMLSVAGGVMAVPAVRLRANWQATGTAA
jgi:polyferredoxin